MFVDFSKYNNEITEVKFNDDDDCDEDCLVLQTSIYKIVLKVYGDCCSCSKIKKPDDFTVLIGKVIKKIKEINFPEEFEYDTESEDEIKAHLYEITFKNSEDKFQFMMVNYSNGYYDGWLTTDIVL